MEVNNFRFLGVNLSHNFSWKCHIDSVRDKLRVCQGIICKARGYLNTGCLLSILHSLATTHLNYCTTTWCNINSALTSKLQGLFNRIFRLIFYRHPQENINDIYKNLALLKVKDKYKFEVCCLTYKFLHQMLPECFNNFFQRNSDAHSRRTRQSDNLHPPLFKKTICMQSIKYCGVKLWNDLPQGIKQSKNLAQFKRRLKQYFLDGY